MPDTRMRTALAAGLLGVAALLAAGCASSPPPPPKLSAAVICQRWEQQTQYLSFLPNPSPSQAAQLDAEVAADARESADPALAAALRAKHGIGETIAAGADPVDAERGVSSICANYP